MQSNFLLPQGVELESLLEILRPLCWGAADILLAYSKGEQPPYGFKKSLAVEDGKDGPVTAADLAVNKWLLDGLTNQFPRISWNLLSEETAKDHFDEGRPVDAEWLWILDPLDGTKDFLQGTSEYAVHLALVHRRRTIFGIVLLPELDELWIGINGFGAWCEDRQQHRTQVNFSQRRRLPDLIVVSSRNHRDERLEQLLSQMGIGSSRSIGSVGCKVASILRGETDLYLSLSGRSAPKDWDMAAPEAVLLAAGGEFTHADGRSLTFNTGDVRQSGCLIASHGFNHDLLCLKAKEILEIIDPEYSV